MAVEHTDDLIAHLLHTRRLDRLELLMRIHLESSCGLPGHIEDWMNFLIGQNQPAHLLALITLCQLDQIVDCHEMQRHCYPYPVIVNSWYGAEACFPSPSFP